MKRFFYGILILATLPLLGLSAIDTPESLREELHKKQIEHARLEKDYQRVLQGIPTNGPVSPSTQNNLKQARDALNVSEIQINQTREKLNTVIQQGAPASATGDSGLGSEDMLQQDLQRQELKRARLEKEHDRIINELPKKGPIDIDTQAELDNLQNDLRNADNSIDQTKEQINQNQKNALPAGGASDQPFSRPLPPQPTPGWEKENKDQNNKDADREKNPSDQPQDDSDKGRQKDLNDLLKNGRIKVDANEFLKPEFNAATRITDFKQAFDKLRADNPDAKIYVMSNGAKFNDVTEFEVMPDGSSVVITFKNKNGDNDQKVVPSPSIQDVGISHSNLKLEMGN